MQKNEIREVTLADVLDARERRAELQKKLLGEYGSTLISFTMNIAGPVKSTPLIERAFDFGLDELLSRLPKDRIFFKSIKRDFCGCEAMISIDMNSTEAKEICMNIEELSCLGRLFDMDVINSIGKKLDRKIERSCIVCGKSGRECAAGRVHSVSEIVAVNQKIMADHFAKIDAERLGELAAECLIKEVETTPKPGLVDRSNSGSHTDMNVDTFRKSVIAIKPYLTECVRIGIENQTNSVSYTFDLLRRAGLLAERSMYDATGGVNTHKGVIYSMGVLLAAIGRLWQSDNPVAKVEDIMSMVSSLVCVSYVDDLKGASGATAGERLYLERGLKGVRGEVAGGFSSVVKYALPIYEKYLINGSSSNDAGVYALLSLIASIDDTNLYNRGGKEGSDFAKSYAKRILNEKIDLDAVAEMDREFIKRRLSPGGSADLLAITYLLYDIKSYK